MTEEETKCIMVNRDNSGCYDIRGTAEEENWDDVKEEMDPIEWYGALKGWGEYKDVFRCVTNEGDVYWYFVER